MSVAGKPLGQSKLSEWILGYYLHALPRPKCEVTIAGNNISSKVLSLRVSKRAAPGADLLNLTLYGEGLPTINPGDLISVKLGYDNRLYKVFEGYVDDLALSFSTSGKTVEISAKSYTQRLLWRLKTESYKNKTAKEIIEDLLSIWDDITTNHVSSSATKYSLTLDRHRVFEAIERLAELEDAVFFIDPDKDMWFIPSGNEPPFGRRLEEGKTYYQPISARKAA